MAWVTKYHGEFWSKGGSPRHGDIYIQEDDWGGGITEVTIARDSISINYLFKGWEDPIIGQNATFDIVNDKADFFTLMELLTATERQFKIIIEEDDPTGMILFEGFLACENTEQRYLQKSRIRLVGSSYMSKLQYVDAPTIEYLETDSFINIIIDCLSQTGSTDDVRINCHLYATGDTLGTTNTLFNLCGVNTEIFWLNNVDRDSALEIIRKILVAFHL